MAEPSHTNRLAKESSPYLLQHAHNPVDWHPWGAEAFSLARRQNKPIFLSVGYSTCYWCHVMERESFENQAVAAEMNARFVNIKVDREERPDVDQLYMTAVQVMTRQGGWPMSVFLTPDLRPFYGGTYFPPTDNYGRPGFVTLLRGIDDAYRNRPADVEKTAGRLVDILGQYAEPSAPEEKVTIDESFIEGLIRRSTSDYDPKFAGFGGAPKFPRETLLELLLVYLQSAGSGGGLKSNVRQMLDRTLDALARGGIRDHLGGGFHRYSTDARWLVPHFEIMLYDNAMLAWCYAEAFRQTSCPRHATVARGIFDFALREMTSPRGAFFTAMDAEVDSREGLNYLWTKEQVVATLAERMGAGASERAEIERFCKVYGLSAGPNFADPHHGGGSPDQNILNLHEPTIDRDADALTAALQDPALAAMRGILKEAREKRKQPLLDTKIITSWNALMIRALAHGGKIFGEPRYIEAASRAADYLLTHHRMPGGGLYRASRDGVAKYAGFIDDYAFMIQALLALASATDQAKWKQSADDLAAVMSRKFADADSGGFYFTEAGATDLIVRQKTASDSPLPSGNAVAAMALLELGQVDPARRTIALFAGALETQAEGMSSMVQAALLLLRQGGPFTVAAEASPPGDGLRPPSVEELALGVVAVKTEWQGPGELLVHLTIAPGYHINAHDVPADLPLVATRVGADVDFNATYPPGEAMKTPLADRSLNVYSGQVTVALHLAAPSPGPSIQLSLRYQACDDSACLPPVTRTLQVDPEA